MPSIRPKRICDGCGAIDDHPRHVVAFAPDEAPAPNAEHVKAAMNAKGLTDDEKVAVIADINDTTLQLRHMDCCRSAGCPDRSCDAIADTGARDLRGPALLKHLTSGEVDHIGQEV